MLSVWMARQQVFYPLIGELIGPLIFGMPCMPLDPTPLYSMPRGHSHQPLPQIGILDRLVSGSSPASTLPGWKPPRDPLFKITGIGRQPDAAGPLERLEPVNCRH